ncbi:MAG: glutaminyl-peptide cyclotransferase [Cytophagales bacterium]|nr:glutaminyl-peptide cyclotransferase [Cytophagales bacterium]
MMWKIWNSFLIPALGLICGAVWACTGGVKEKAALPRSKALARTSLSVLSSRELSTEDSLVFLFKSKGSSSLRIDSIRVDSDLLDGLPWEQQIAIPMDSFPLGSRQLGIRIFLSEDSLQIVENHSLSFHLRAAHPPLSYEYEIVDVYLHDPEAYTQGLFLYQGFIYEGTGQKGHSRLRKINYHTGDISMETALDDAYFGEGITYLDDKIYQLTWKSQKGFIYDLHNLDSLGIFEYETEGWGITHYQGYLVLSNGTEYLSFYRPEDFVKVKEIQVYTHEDKVDQLNELETVGGLIFANQYQTSLIWIINPENGEAIGKVDCSSLLQKHIHAQKSEVMNGIAYDETRNTFFVTGKWWPKLFEIKIYPGKKPRKLVPN